MVNATSIESQYVVRYFLDYLIKTPCIMGERKLKKTRLISRRSPPLWGKVVAIAWKEDDSLVQTLNLDYNLEDKVIRADMNVCKGNIGICS